MYGGIRGNTRSESKRHKIMHGSGPKASKHQVGTSQSGSGPWKRHGSSTGFWTGKNGVGSMPKFSTPSKSIGEEEGG